MFIISYNYINYTQKNIKELSVKQLESIGYITLERLKEYLNNNEEKVRLFNSRLLLQKTLLSYLENPDKKSSEIIENILKLSYTQRGSIEDIIILDTNANVIVSRNNRMDIDKRMMTMMFTKSLNGTYSHLSFMNESKIPLLCIASPIFKDEKFVGMTVFRIKLSTLNDMLKQRGGLDNTGEALLGTYDENGNIVLFSPLRFLKYPLVISVNDANSAIPMKIALEKKAHYIIDNEFDYRDERVVSTVHYFEPLKIGIVVKKDIKEIMQPIKELKIILFQITLMGIAISIIISYILSLYVIRFINHIVDITSKISNGDFNQRVEIFTNDELEIIANSINKMANSLVGMNLKLEKRVEEKTHLLKESNNKLNYIFNITPNITILTSGNTMVKANNKFFEFTGFNSIEEFLKQYSCICDMFQIRSGYLKPKMGEKSWVEYIVSNPDEMHKAIIEKDGVEQLFLVNATAYTSTGETNYIAVFENITEIQKVAHTDQLTKLANRLKIDEILEGCLQSSKRYKSVFTVILIDIDFFKNVNDNHGHLAGDEILKEISIILSTLTRNVDLVGRWGGEEFIIVSKETNIAGAYAMAEKIRKVVQGHTFASDLHVTISMGISEYKDNENIDELVKRADDALYRAKENGRNRVEVIN
jgi:diguanylate cyclase (GGDEF)-like protein